MNDDELKEYFEMFLINNYLYNIYYPERVKCLKEKHNINW